MISHAVQRQESAAALLFHHIARAWTRENLVLDNLLGSSWAAGGSIEVQFAAHIQGTSMIVGSSSETIRGTIPEPATGTLLVSALALLGVGSSRRHKRFGIYEKRPHTSRTRGIRSPRPISI